MSFDVDVAATSYVAMHMVLVLEVGQNGTHLGVIPAPLPGGQVFNR